MPKNPAPKPRKQPTKAKKPYRKREPLKTAKAAPGRPTIYSDALADEFCQRVALGRSPTSVSQDPDMPDAVTVWRWRNDDNHPQFCKMLSRARDAQDEIFADQIRGLGLAVMHKNDAGVYDGPPPDRVRAAVDAHDKAGRLINDRRAKRVQVTGPDGGPLEAVDLTGMSPEQMKEYRELLAQARRVAVAAASG